MAMKFRKKTLLAKLEVTYGTDPVPTGAANAIQTKDLEIMPLEAEALSRALDKEDLGADPATMVGQYVMVRFKVEMAGSGTAGQAPAYAPLLIACGYDETLDPTPGSENATYTPVDDAVSVCLYVKQDTVLHKVTGCRGALKLTGGMRQFGYFEFEFIGLFNAPEHSAASLSPVLSAFVQPLPWRASTVEASLFGNVICLRDMTVTAGQSNNLFECSESEQIELEDRQGKFDVKFTEPLITTENYWSDAANDTIDEFSFVHGTTAGNIVEFVAANAQITQVKRDNQNGNMVIAASGPLARVAGVEHSIIVR